MGLKLTGKINVIHNKYGYSTTIGSKKADGTWENSYLPLTFKKGVEIADKTEIEVLDGFLSFYKVGLDGKDYTKFKAVIMDYRLAGNAHNQSTGQVTGQVNQGLTENSTEDLENLPF